MYNLKHKLTYRKCHTKTAVWTFEHLADSLEASIT